MGREVEGSKESMDGGEDAMKGREGTRTRRAAWHANIGFSVRTFGPSARKRLFGALFPPYGWIAMDGEEIVPYEKAEYRPRTTFSTAAKFYKNRPTDQPTGGRTMRKLG